MQEFYESRYDFIPDNLRREMGHFNIFKLAPYAGENANPVPYTRRVYFKITLLVGKSTIEYAGKIIALKKQALVFSNPQIPYRWKHTNKIRNGFFCVFDEAFFHQYGNLHLYSVFQPQGNHVFELTNEQVKLLNEVYNRMFDELNSNYIHKYDMIRTIVSEILHFAMKMEPSEAFNRQPINAPPRVAILFMG